MCRPRLGPGRVYVDPLVDVAPIAVDGRVVQAVSLATNPSGHAADAVMVLPQPDTQEGRDCLQLDLWLPSAADGSVIPEGEAVRKARPGVSAVVKLTAVRIPYHGS